MSSIEKRNLFMVFLIFGQFFLSFIRNFLLKTRISFTVFNVFMLTRGESPLTPEETPNASDVQENSLQSSGKIMDESTNQINDIPLDENHAHLFASMIDDPILVAHPTD